MRWAVLCAGAVISLAGCQHVPVSTPDGLPGGVTPHSFRVRPAVPGDQPLAPQRTAPAPPAPQTTQAIAILSAPRPIVPKPEEPRPLPAVVQTAAVLPAPAPETTTPAAPIVLAAFRPESVARPEPAAQPGPAALPEPARPAAGHAPDFRWLVGELTRERGIWGVRFGGADDRHRGHLALLDPGRMSGLEVGQMVRVEGVVVEPGPHEVKPSYRVRALVAVNQ